MKVTCVVDNAVQRSSPFWGEHGLAFLIETDAGRVLFDTGQSGAVLLHNLELLGVAPATIDALAISHAHYDHTGGLPDLLEHLRSGVPLYANSDLFRERFSQREGKPQNIGLSLTRDELTARLTLKLSAAPQEILPGVWTTGEIVERPEPEGSSAYHLVRDGDAFVSDSYQDDRGLVLKIDGRQVLLCGCCHAGLLNTLAHVQRAFELPVTAIAGGLHLTSATADHLQRVGEVLVEADKQHPMESVQRIYPNHCTGEAAFIALTLTLGPSVVYPCPVGTVVEFPVW